PPRRRSGRRRPRRPRRASRPPRARSGTCARGSTARGRSTTSPSRRPPTVSPRRASRRRSRAARARRPSADARLRRPRARHRRRGAGPSPFPPGTPASAPVSIAPPVSAAPAVSIAPAAAGGGPRPYSGRAMTKTLFVTNDFPPRPGGIQAFVHGLALRRPPGSVVVYAPDWKGAAEFDAAQPFPVVRHPGSLMLPEPGVLRRAGEVVRAGAWAPA